MVIEELSTAALEQLAMRIAGELATRAEVPLPETTQRSPKLVYRQSYTRCGKAGCRRCADGGQGHGPYWYAYWSEGGKTRSKYLGKQRPGAVDQAGQSSPLASVSAAVAQLLAVVTIERQPVQAVYRQLGWTRQQLERCVEVEQSVLGELGVRLHVATHKAASGRREGYITVNGMRRSHISRDQRA